MVGRKLEWEGGWKIFFQINYYSPPLTIVFALAIKAVGFSKVSQTLSNIFAMHYGDNKD